MDNYNNYCVLSGKMDLLKIILLFLCCGKYAASDYSASNCMFPPEWQGLWYDSGHKEFRITSKSISGKGTCRQSEGNKYLILNQMKSSLHTKCFTCIVFHPWHHNLLQYKESHCWQEESVSTVCGKITSENPLVTVVKVRSIPEPCPFQGSYTFSYINGSVECYQPPSQIRACADESKFRFVYRQCNNIPGTSNQELEFQCLATWESGDKFLYGKFEKLDDPESEQSYRCFMHSFYGTTGDMSMSADGTCQGLQSASLGVLTMKLSKDMGSYTRGSCKFPNFLIRHQQWRDMTGRYRLELDDGLQVIRVKNRHRTDVITYTELFDTSVTRLLFRCVDDLGNADLISHHHPETESQHFIAFTTDDNCVSEDKCLLFNKRSDDVIEMMIGTAESDFQLSCNYDDGEHFLFKPETIHGNKCPSFLSGKYDYTDKASDCTGSVRIGCSHSDEILIETSCPLNRQSVKILKCLHSWQEGSSTFSIVRYSGDDTDTLFCLAFFTTEFGINVQESTDCKGDKTVVTNKFLNYLLYTPREKCKVKSDDVQSDQNQDKADGEGLIHADDNGNAAAAVSSHAFIYILVIYHSFYYSLILDANCT